MATRVGLLDSDSDVSETEDELTPLGVANRSRKPPVDDDFMDEDAPGGFSESLGRGDAIDLTDAMRALREHEDAVRAIENGRYVDADVDAAATSAARAREDAETRDGDSNGRAAVSTARPRAPLAAKAVAVAVRALELKSSDVRTSAPTTFETTIGGGGRVRGAKRLARGGARTERRRRRAGDRERRGGVKSGAHAGDLRERRGGARGGARSGGA